MFQGDDGVDVGGAAVPASAVAAVRAGQPQQQPDSGGEGSVGGALAAVPEGGGGGGGGGGDGQRRPRVRAPAALRAHPARPARPVWASARAVGPVGLSGRPSPAPAAVPAAPAPRRRLRPPVRPLPAEEGGVAGAPAAALAFVGARQGAAAPQPHLGASPHVWRFYL